MKDDLDLDPLRSLKKKRKNVKKKGNNFENKIAKVFNEKFNTTEFCRSPGSGAFGTTHKLPSYMQVYGDLITPLNFNYIIELKKGYNKERVSNLFNSNSIIYDFIAQAERDSEKSSKKSFLLILGQDNLKPIVIFDKEESIITDLSYMSVVVNITRNNKTYTGCLLEEFLAFPEIKFRLFKT